jgi:hypothetical protein
VAFFTEDVPVLIRSGRTCGFPAQGDSPIRVMDMTGKERITAFVSVGTFSTGNTLRGRGSSDVSTGLSVMCGGTASEVLRSWTRSG